MTTENNSLTGHETARQLVNKIKSQKTKADMQTHAVWIRTTLKMPYTNSSPDQWRDICQILKKEIPELYQYLSENKLLRDPVSSGSCSGTECIFPLLIISFILFMFLSLFFTVVIGAIISIVVFVILLLSVLYEK